MDRTVWWWTSTFHACTRPGCQVGGNPAHLVRPLYQHMPPVGLLAMSGNRSFCGTLGEGSGCGMPRRMWCPTQYLPVSSRYVALHPQTIQCPETIRLAQSSELVATRSTCCTCLPCIVGVPHLNAAEMFSHYFPVVESFLSAVQLHHLLLSL